MPPSTDRPLITFLLLSYNQEEFIRNAISAAFAQTYTPLEILLTDDCSTDRTYEIICEMAEAYRGPHTIALNRNVTNLGIGAHINRAMMMVNGELIVIAAGDDISLDVRTEKIFQAWKSFGGGTCSIFSDAFFIDQEGQLSGKRLINGKPTHEMTAEAAVARGGIGVAGCSHAFSRRLFELFGPMDDSVVAEDMVIPFRALLLGTIHYIAEPLIYYRTHVGNISIGTAVVPLKEKVRREKINQEAVMLTWFQDVRVACKSGHLSLDKADSLKLAIISKLRWGILEKRFYDTAMPHGIFLLLTEMLSCCHIRRPFKLIERRLRSYWKYILGK